MSAPLPSQIRIAIAEDHAVFRNAIKTFLLSLPDINLVIEATNGQELVDRLADSKPEIILLDIEMPVMNGIQALSLIRLKYPEIKVIMLSMHNDHSLISNVMNLGAYAYLPKTTELNVIGETIMGLRGT